MQFVWTLNYYEHPVTMNTQSAVIFDLDGVISDTQRIHSTAEASLLVPYGIVVTPEALAQEFSGVGDDEMFELLFARYLKRQPPLDILLAQKWQLVNAALQASIPTVPGAVPLIERLARRGVKLAIASGSPEEFIHRVVRDLSLEAAFPVRVSADNVARGKPAPDVFLEAARQLQVEPHKCTVIEDGVSGMQGACAAGMRCIGLVTDIHAVYPAHAVVGSLEDITDELLALIKVPIS
jgi:HAD superfamily hydrolase (TIGR01509 family)